MAGVTLIASTIFGIFVAIVCAKFLYKIWWWPKMMEKKLKKQGIHGPPYKFLFGNLKEMMRMSKEAKSKPLSLTHDIMPWLNPFLQHLANNHSKSKFLTLLFTSDPFFVVMFSFSRVIWANLRS